MRIDQLEFLLEIEKRKSFSKASEHLHLTAQSLSRSVVTMEKELGFQLFLRSSQGVTFTKEGQLFLETARKIVGEYHGALKRLQALQIEEQKIVRGELIVYANPLFNIQWLPKVLKQFCKSNPLVRVTVLEKNSREIYRRLQQANEENDLVTRVGLVLVPYNRQDFFVDNDKKNMLHFAHLSEERYCVYASKNSVLATYSEISITEVLKNPIVLFSSSEDNDTPVYAILEQYGDVNVVFTASSFSLWLDTIKNGVGIGLFQDIFLDKEKEEMCTGIVRIKLKEDISAILGYLYGGECSKILKLFIKCLSYTE